MFELACLIGVLVALGVTVRECRRAERVLEQIERLRRGGD